MTRYIDGHKARFGVEPICRTLQVAPSSYYAAKRRAPSIRRRRDEALKPEVQRVHRENFGVYGIEKIWRQLSREQILVGRDRVQRLMRELKLRGVVRGKRVWTTIPEARATRPADLVERQFVATAPNRLWVADLTYVRTWGGFVYTALIIDAFSRAIVGWCVATSLRADLALDALEMAIWSRQPSAEDRLIHHSDRGVQYLAIRYSERLAEAGAVTSVGSRGDSYDNALAETVMGLYKTELIRRRGPWRTVEQVEFATAEWVDWWNRRRLHSAAANLPPSEFEQRHYDQQAAAGVA
jgi:putative transposase